MSAHGLPLVFAWPLGLEVHVVAVVQQAEHHGDSTAIQKGVRDLLAHWNKFPHYPHGLNTELMEWLEACREKLLALENDGLRIQPSCTTLLHQLDWAAGVCRQQQKSLIITASAQQGDDLLRDHVHSDLQRLFSARDLRIRMDVSQDPIFTGELAIDSVTEFLDHVMEEVEDICLSLGQVSLTELQGRVDTAQRFLQQGLQAAMSSGGAAIVTPLIGGVKAFLESIDQVLHAFHDHPDRACGASLAMIALDEGLRAPGTVLTNGSDTERNWRRDLMAASDVLMDARRAESLWTLRDSRKRRTALLSLRRGKSGQLGRTERQLNPLVVHRLWHSYLCLGPRVLGGLALTAASEAIDDRKLAKAARLLAAFHPPNMTESLGDATVRSLAGWTAWLVPIVIYLPWVLQSWFPSVIEAAGPVLNQLPFLALLAGFIIIAALLPTWTRTATRELDDAHWWSELSARVHRGLLLPPFLFKAGFGVAIAAANEFDYQLWTGPLRSAWWQVALLLLVLSAIGCYAQVQVGLQRARLYATGQTLAIYVAIAHVPALPAAMFLHQALKEASGSRLPATLSIGLWDYSLYCVFFFALTGLVIGLIGETFLRNRRERSGFESE